MDQETKAMIKEVDRLRKHQGMGIYSACKAAGIKRSLYAYHHYGYGARKKQKLHESRAGEKVVFGVVPAAYDIPFVPKADSTPTATPTIGADPACIVIVTTAGALPQVLRSLS